MTAAIIYPPISVTICDNAREVVRLLRDLAGHDSAFRRGVKSLFVSIIVGEYHLGFDIQREFLDIYPNLRELDLTGFDYLMGCTPEFEIDLRRTGGRGMEPSSEKGVFSLRRLTLEACRLEPHSLRMLFERTRRTPHLTDLEFSKITFKPGKTYEHLPPLPYTLDKFSCLVNDDDAAGSGSFRGWTAPFAGSSRTTSPKWLAISFFHRRDLDELQDPDVDLSHVGVLSLFVSRLPSAMGLSDYAMVVARCSGLEDLYMFADEGTLAAELVSLLSNLTGPLRSIAVVTYPPHMTAPVLEGTVEAELLKALDLPQIRGIRQFELHIFAALRTHTFPLLTASCRARRIQFACVIDDLTRFS